jgi:hypothetical protein
VRQQQAGRATSDDRDLGPHFPSLSRAPAGTK